MLFEKQLAATIYVRPAFRFNLFVKAIAKLPKFQKLRKLNPNLLQKVFPLHSGLFISKLCDVQRLRTASSKWIWQFIKV